MATAAAAAAAAAYHAPTCHVAQQAHTHVHERRVALEAKADMARLNLAEHILSTDSWGRFYIDVDF
jgi:hypothetical protein